MRSEEEIERKLHTVRNSMPNYGKDDHLNGMEEALEWVLRCGEGG